MTNTQSDFEKGLDLLNQASDLLPALKVDKEALKVSVKNLFDEIKADNEARIPKLNFPTVQFQNALARVEKLRGLEVGEVAAEEKPAAKEKKSKGKS